MAMIEDGTGRGSLAEVSLDHRLKVDSLSQDTLKIISDERGDAYYICTDFMSLTTTGSYSAVFGLTYTGTKHLHIRNIRTCGTAVQQWRILSGVTTGTFIGSATSAHQHNLNFHSNNVLSATIKKGADGLTFTNGSIVTHWVNDVGHSQQDTYGALILYPGDSIFAEVKPSAAGDVCTSWLVSEEETIDKL